MKFPKLMIAGMSSGVGKTTLTMGILSALSEKMVVQSYKVGPDYIDPAYHTLITGRKCRNLDNYLLSNETVEQLFYKNSKDAQIGIIEGVMGLYDGAQVNSDIGSSASIAKVLKCPVVLVVDGSGIAKSVAAIVKGFIEFDPAVKLSGVILNKVNSIKHYCLLKEAIEQFTTAKCYGYLPKNEIGTLKSRHLGLIPSCEIEDLKLKLECVSKAVEETVDLEGLLQLAYREAEEVTIEIPIYQTLFKDLHIGVAYDEAFNFYYEDNLDLFKELGATIQFFSPIRDSRLPENIHFLYFGGGFPEMFAQELSDNHLMKKDIKEKLEMGMPYLAECGGLMYLTKQLIDFDEKIYRMVGWLDGTCSMTKRLQRFGYKTLTLKENCILGEKDEVIPIHEFHHSKTEVLETNTVFGLKKMKEDKVIAAYECGYLKGKGVAGYPHFHFHGNPSMAINLLQAAQTYANNK
ncbi:MAG: cobyrinate a,c-diamide synthase [Firmicutes bacterium HGW-Firmicutes-7]|nr:MAG: cobyrinate a,c-diamide synthase [Firmicutes bacterium HGW-Firmicutes-7]